ncbi:thioredoxin-like protein [Xylariaceae sp. AK1471]|nr:thioredoxin-like protein [Xylariaceae sp. AK1471]
MQVIRVQDLLISDEKSSDNSAKKGESLTRPNPTSLETQYFVIEFIHDTICPFCYIGMKNLFMAIDIYKSRHPDAIFEVTCTPFILAPTAQPSYHYYSAYRGLPKSRFDVWNKLGEKAGIKFSWNGITGNSRKSHKLLRFALQQSPTTQRSTELTVYGPDTNAPLYPPYTLRAPDLPVSLAQPRGPDLQMRLLDAITKNYHENDNDLSDAGFLMDTAIAVTGFPRNEIQDVLNSEEWDRTIDMLSHEVQNRLSVRSKMAGPIIAVPTMVLNNRWVYGGFQKVDEIVEQFELLRQGISPHRIAREAKIMESGCGSSGND